MFGADDTETAEVRIDLGEVIALDGRFEAAIELFQIGLETLSKRLGEEHPTLVKTLIRTAELAHRIADFDVRAECLQRVLTICARAEPVRGPRDALATCREARTLCGVLGDEPDVDLQELLRLEGEAQVQLDDLPSVALAAAASDGGAVSDAERDLMKLRSELLEALFDDAAARIRVLRVRIRDAEAAVARAHPRRFSILEGEPLLARIARGLHEDAAWIEFVPTLAFEPPGVEDDGRSRCCGWGKPINAAIVVLGADRVLRWVELDSISIVRRLDAYRAAAQGGGSSRRGAVAPPRPSAKAVTVEAAELAREIGSQWWGPIESGVLDCDTLIVSPSVMSYRVPLESLLLEDGRFLVEKHRVSYALSASRLAAFDAPRPRDAIRSGSVLLIGGVDFGESRGPASSPDRPANPIVDASNWSALPGTDTEVAALDALHRSTLPDLAPPLLLRGAGSRFSRRPASPGCASPPWSAQNARHSRPSARGSKPIARSACTCARP
ncbi:MAG: CHAT domain-containing protein [Planctomycetes bacterium]|nr:CHAT domain-containing protein [Planctomycetota bacterium]